MSGTPATGWRIPKNAFTGSHVSLQTTAGIPRPACPKYRGQRVGVNPQTIGYLERGECNPSLVLAFRLADLISVMLVFPGPKWWAESL
jgi:hypothetical protein